MRIVGSRWSPRVHELKAFLSRSRRPYRWIEAEDRDRVVVHFPDGSTLQDPAVRDVARKLGLDVEPESRTYDLIVVGGGPAGLTAAIHAAADGLRRSWSSRRCPAVRRATAPWSRTTRAFLRV